ncbi:MAG: hypothetical protein U5N86_13650 [Planctomycetota bacterium]|nr:hypothetical protein [Planctomycetota bacterium]
MREEWGYRRPGEVLMSELSSGHYVTKGVSLSELREQESSGELDLERALMFTLLGIVVAAFTFLSLFPLGVKKEEKPDPQVEIGKADTQRLRKSEHLND